MDQSATSRSTRQVLSEGESMAVIFEGFGLTGRNWNLTSFIVPVWFVLADSNLVSEFNAGRRSICSVFLMQSVRRADSRADCTAGKCSEDGDHDGQFDPCGAVVLLDSVIENHHPRLLTVCMTSPRLIENLDFLSTPLAELNGSGCFEISI